MTFEEWTKAFGVGKCKSPPADIPPCGVCGTGGLQLWLRGPIGEARYYCEGCLREIYEKFGACLGENTEHIDEQFYKWLEKKDAEASFIPDSSTCDICNTAFRQLYFVWLKLMPNRGYWHMCIDCLRNIFELEKRGETKDKRQP